MHIYNNSKAINHDVFFSLDKKICILYISENLIYHQDILLTEVQKKLDIIRGFQVSKLHIQANNL